jgi:hypothetical protein
MYVGISTPVAGGLGFGPQLGAGILGWELGNGNWMGEIHSILLVKS